MNIKVWYLYHSGFAVEVGRNLLIFDYYLDKPANRSDKRSLTTGVINPQELKEYNVFVFSSHNHADHHQDFIYRWQEVIPNITYILSDDIKTAASTNIYKIAAHQELSLPGFTVSTLLSNDAGVAFVIKFEDIIIYHAGDLNWWHWQEEPEAWNNEIERIFKQELQNLSNSSIDIAFLPVDPRLKESYSKSLVYFCKNIANNKTYIFPMHFADDYTIFDQLEKDNLLNDKIMRIQKRGQEFSLVI